MIDDVDRTRLRLLHHGPVAVRGPERRGRGGRDGGGSRSRGLRVFAARSAISRGARVYRLATSGRMPLRAKLAPWRSMAPGGRHLGVLVRPHRVGAPTQISAAGDGALSGNVGYRPDSGDRTPAVLSRTAHSAIAVMRRDFVRQAGVEL